MQFLKVALSLVLISPTALAATAAQWRSRSIYQIITDRFARTDGSITAACDTADQVYCGGTWQGIINHLDYIQGMGFDAIWISPITKQIDRPSSFHGYWQNDIYSLNSAFGTASDLKALAAALHARDMYLMVDIVVNHFAYNGTPTAVDYSSMNPWNNVEYYHDYCIIDYSDMDDLVSDDIAFLFQHIVNSTDKALPSTPAISSAYTNSTSSKDQLEDCWTGGTNPALPDLRTEDSNVANEWYSWVSELVSNYSIDGIRLDSAMMVNTDFWAGFLDAAGVYMIGEVYEYDSSWVCNYQNYLPGILNYPLYQPLIAAFESTSGDMSKLGDTITAIAGECSDTSLLGTFSENHDQPRFAYLNSDMALAKNIIAFTILTDGIPIIYDGQEQHYDAAGDGSTGTDPYDREAIWFSAYSTTVTLVELITSLNAIRKNAISDSASYLTDTNIVLTTGLGYIVMKKGKMVSVLTNEGANAGSSTATFASRYSDGEALTELLTCDTLTVSSTGSMSVSMDAGVPRIYYPTADIGSLCSGSSKQRRVARDFSA